MIELDEEELLEEEENIVANTGFSIDSNGIIRQQQQNDLKESLQELNDDTVELSGFSKIDMRARLVSMEIPPILAVDSLVALGVFPNEMSKLTRSKKRLSVSVGGLGRTEMIQLSQADRERKMGLNSVMDKMRGGQ